MSGLKNMIKYIKQINGENWYIGIEGTPAKIQGEKNAIYNWRYSDGQLMDLGKEENFFFFLTSEEKFLRAQIDRNINLFCQQNLGRGWIGVKYGFLTYAKKLAIEKWKTIPQENFLKLSTIIGLESF